MLKNSIGRAAPDIVEKASDLDGMTNADDWNWFIKGTFIKETINNGCRRKGLLSGLLLRQPNKTNRVRKFKHLNQTSF